MDLTRVIIRPLISEKTYQMQEQEIAKYGFVVHKLATKKMIKRAFMAIFGIEPLSVNTLIRKPRPTRHTKHKTRGYTKLVKIAYISLPKGQKLALDADENSDNQVGA